MRKVFALLGIIILLTAAFAARATTVFGNLYDLQLADLPTKLLFTPTNLVLIGTGGLSAGAPKQITTTHGAFSTALDNGDYWVSLPDIPTRKAFVISVYATNQPVNITNLMNPPRTYIYSGPSPPLEVAAGSNVTIATNGVLRTISSTGGSSNPNALTNNDTRNVVLANSAEIRGALSLSNIISTDDLSLPFGTYPITKMFGEWVWTGNYQTQMFALFDPELHVGQNILYMGAGLNGEDQFDASTLQVRATNSSGQMHGQKAPRITFMYKTDAANYGSSGLGAYVYGWRLEPTNMTLSAEYNLGVAQDPLTAGFYPSFIWHNNTNQMWFGPDQWTNAIYGNAVLVGPKARSSGSNTVTIGAATNLFDNTVLIGFNNLNASFRPTAITLGGASFNITTNTLSLFTGSATFDDGGNFTFDGAMTGDSGDFTSDGAGNVTASSFAGAGSSLTALNASSLSSGTVPTARLGSGTANSSTVLYGNNTWGAAAGGISWPSTNGILYSSNQAALTLYGGFVSSNLTTKGVGILTNASLLLSNGTTGSWVVTTNASTVWSNAANGASVTISNGLVGATNLWVTNLATFANGIAYVTPDGHYQSDVGLTAGGQNFVAGGTNNYGPGTATYTTIVGGDANTNSGGYSAIAGGNLNVITNALYCGILGGKNNFIGYLQGYSTILGGVNNTISNNVTDGGFCSILGGQGNKFGSSSDGTIFGGQNNYVKTIGFYGFAGGMNANCTNAGAWVLTDSTGTDFYSVTNDTFNARFRFGAFFDLGVSNMVVKGGAVITNTLTVGTNVPSFTTNAFTVATSTDKQAFRVGTDGKLFHNAAATFTGPITNAGALQLTAAAAVISADSGNSLTVSGGNSGALYLGVGTTFGRQVRVDSTDAKLANTIGYAWSSDNTSFGTADVGLFRNAAGVIEVNNGTHGTVTGTIKAGHYLNAAVKWETGTGSPEGAVTAPVGSLYSRTDGGAATSLYVKESGSGNTGWVGK